MKKGIGETGGSVVTGAGAEHAREFLAMSQQAQSDYDQLIGITGGSGENPYSTLKRESDFLAGNVILKQLLGFNDQ